MNKNSLRVIFWFFVQRQDILAKFVCIKLEERHKSQLLRNLKKEIYPFSNFLRAGARRFIAFF